MRTILRLITVALLGLLLLPPLAVAGAPEGLSFTARPLAGPAGTLVTVAGRGPKAFTTVEVAGGFRIYPEGCAVPLHGGQGQPYVFARTMSDSGGNFTVQFRILPDSRSVTLAFFTVVYDEMNLGQAPARACFDLTDNLRTFPETGFTVRGSFLVYWEEHGGLAINGYPISNVFTEVLENGKAYTVQYFERVRMEYHDDESFEPLILLGAFGRRIHPADPPVPAIPGALYFAPTGHNVTRQLFADYWNRYGGLAQFGYPITEEISERLGGTVYRVQYFERARFEYHPENAAPYNILLGQFGRQILAEANPR